MSERVSKEVKNKLAEEVNKAIGYRSISQFIQDCKMTDPSLIKNIINKQIEVLPEREVLRVIERASQGRVTFLYLCEICGYSKYDINEDRSWMKYYPTRGSIYYADLGYNMDSEQSGLRPVLIIQNNIGNEYSSTVSVAPLTTKEKRHMPTHVWVTTKEGMKQNSIICIEQTRVISKRRLFYNGAPNKILNLSDEKIFEVNVAIEKQFGLIDCLYNEDLAFELVEQILILNQNIKQTKQPKGLLTILESRKQELITYCAKYHRNHEVVVRDYMGNESYAM